MQELWEDMGQVAKWAIVVFFAGLIIGGIVLGWEMMLGPAFNNADYNNFNTSQQHLQAVAQKFSDDCLQLAETTDPVEKKAIEQDIYSVAASVDVTKVSMPSGVRSCVNNAIATVTRGK